MGAYDERELPVSAPTARWDQERECYGCALRFDVKKGSKRAFCTAPCRSLYIRSGGERLEGEHPAGVKALTGSYPFAECAWCGDEFPVRSVRAKFCSDGCAVRAHVNGRRRRLAAVNAGVYSKLEIFERDGWVCQLCFEDIDPHEKWPSDWCATVDHVMPISEGGTDRISNLQAAHWRCNRDKGNSVPDMGVLF